MPVAIKCPNCKARPYDNWKEYAEHVLNAHKYDKTRCTWAGNCLKDASQTVVQAPAESEEIMVRRIVKEMRENKLEAAPEPDA